MRKWTGPGAGGRDRGLAPPAGWCRRNRRRRRCRLFWQRHPRCLPNGLLPRMCYRGAANVTAADTVRPVAHLKRAPRRARRESVKAELALSALGHCRVTVLDLSVRVTPRRAAHVALAQLELALLEPAGGRHGARGLCGRRAPLLAQAVAAHTTGGRCNSFLVVLV